MTSTAEYRFLKEKITKAEDPHELVSLKKRLAAVLEKPRSAQRSLERRKGGNK